MRGAPRKEDIADHHFRCIVQAKRLFSDPARRAGVLVTKSEVSLAVELGEGRLALKKRGPKYTAAAEARYARSYRRKLKEGWVDDQVPDGIAALYSSPPRT